jgi:hypothetical protein
MHPIRLLAACAAVGALSGCAALVAPPYSPDYQSLDALKKTPLEKVAVAPVQPRDASAPVNRITLRGATLASPKGTFAQYLEDALVQDLREISAFDPAAGLRIDATVLKNTMDVSGFSTGSGQMEVDLSVKRGATTLHRKTYQASTSFESSFAGAVAIPKGQLEYANLVRALLSKVYADPQFINALKK